MEVQKIKHQLKVEQWKERIVACRSSGMSVKAWCKENQICCKTYYRWEKEVLQEQKSEADTAANPLAQLSAPTFAQIPVIPQIQAEDQNAVTASIRIGRAEIDVYSGADADVIAAICQAVKSC